LVDGAITKYNLRAPAWQRPATATRVVLVVGQVESDASIRLGAPGVRRNLELLKAVRRAEPDAYLVYKPHPDVVAGLCRQGEGEGRVAEVRGLVLRLGRDVALLSLALAAQLLVEPDRGSNLFDIAPRLLIHFEDLERTGLIGPGSRVRYQFLAAGPPPAVESLRAWLETQMQPGQRLLDLEDANPELREAVNRAQRFLGLASLMAVLLAFLFWYLVRSQAVVRRGYLYEQPNFPARGQL
jgi:hypothetical protein